MEFLNTINLEQLGTAGIFIAFLIWQGTKKDQILKDSEAERREWQAKAFDVTRESQQELMEATRLFERMYDKVKS